MPNVNDEAAAEAQERAWDKRDVTLPASVQPITPRRVSLTDSRMRLMSAVATIAGESMTYSLARDSKNFARNVHVIRGILYEIDKLEDIADGICRLESCDDDF